MNRLEYIIIGVLVIAAIPLAQAAKKHKAPAKPAPVAGYSTSGYALLPHFPPTCKKGYESLFRVKDGMGTAVCAKVVIEFKKYVLKRIPWKVRMRLAPESRWTNARIRFAGGSFASIP